MHKTTIKTVEVRMTMTMTMKLKWCNGTHQGTAQKIFKLVCTHISQPRRIDQFKMTKKDHENELPVGRQEVSSSVMNSKSLDNVTEATAPLRMMTNKNEGGKFLSRQGELCGMKKKTWEDQTGVTNTSSLTDLTD